MPIGMIILIIVSILIFMGLAHRVLDRLRLNDKTALAIIIAIVLSSIFIPDINLTQNLSINVGGFIIPAALAIYLFIMADTKKEKGRALIATLVAGLTIYLAQRYILPAEPEAQFIEPNYVYAILAAIIAYVLGRSRRGAFIAGVMGVVLSDIVQGLINWINNNPTPVRLGGAGGADTTIIAGVLAVILAEIVGETREKIRGGTDRKDMRFDKGHFVSGLGEGDNDVNNGGDNDEKDN